MNLKRKILISLALEAFGLLAYFYHSENVVAFQSEESSVPSIGKVFNRISFQQEGEKDIWLMQQSQGKFHSKFTEWDRLAIVVDRSQSPKVARFYQLEPGAMALSGREIEYKVACGMCHVNGPRVVRAVDSGDAPLGILEKMHLFVWNQRIRNYGRVIADSSMAAKKLNQETRRVPFQFSGEVVQKKLMVHACSKCHSESDHGRGFLTAQNFPTITFMMERGYMPPRGKKISIAARKEIQAFLRSAHGGVSSKN